MATDTEQRPSRLKAVAIFLLLAVVPVAALILTRVVQGPPAEGGVEQMNLGVRLVVSIALSTFGSVATVGAYVLVLFTTCFTFRFQRPVYSGFKKKLYLANIAIPVLAIMPAAAFVDTVLVAAALILGASAPSWWVAIIPALVVVNLATSFFNVWSPVESRLIAHRLAAQGVVPSRRRSGIYLGISDPSGRDWAKMMLEDDVGML